MRFTLALLAAATAVMAQGPISQISDGQIQNPTTPIAVSTYVPYPAGNSSSVAPVGTAYSSAAAPSGPYSNSTASAGSTASSTPSATSSPAGTSSSSPESTGAAAVVKVGGLSIAAAMAALVFA